MSMTKSKTANNTIQAPVVELTLLKAVNITSKITSKTGAKSPSKKPATIGGASLLDIKFHLVAVRFKSF